MTADRHTITTPTLAAITLRTGGDGVAVVSRLLWQALQAQWTNLRVVELSAKGACRPTLAQKVRFAVDIAAAQAAQRTDWLLFSHLGLAQVQDGIPLPLRQPYAVFLHGIEAWDPLTPREKRVLMSARLRLANSSYTARRVMERHPDVGIVESCPLALPLASPAEAAAEASLPALGPHAVLMVGRMVSTERYKGHDQMIDAWPAVVACVPGARLVVVGEGDDRQRLEDKAAAGAVAGSIVFTGFASEPVLGALYRRAALFALPSRGEGFGLVYLEAMAHRLACIGSRHDAAGDIIVDGATGVLVDQEDVAGVARAIVSLLQNDVRRRAMGDAGYRRLHEHFTFEQFSRRLRDLMTDAVARTDAVRAFTPA